MCDAPDTLRSVKDIGGVPRLEFLGVFERAERDAARVEEFLRREE